MLNEKYIFYVLVIVIVIVTPVDHIFQNSYKYLHN